MRYALCEDPRNHRFAIVPLPARTGDDDTVPMMAGARWFNSREEAVAALPSLLNGDDDEAASDDQEPRIDGGGRPHGRQFALCNRDQGLRTVRT